MAPSEVALPADKAERNNLVASGQAPMDTASLEDFGPFSELVRFINTLITLPGHDQNSIEELLQTIMAVLSTITTMAMIVPKRKNEHADTKHSVRSPVFTPEFDYSDRKDRQTNSAVSTIRGANFLGTITDCEVDASQHIAGGDQYYGEERRHVESRQEAHSSGDGGPAPFVLNGGCFGNINKSKINTEQGVAGGDQYLPQKYNSRAR